ncbi:MAG: hypothetical protein ACYTKC_17030, partial [Planctomycetota bacterium]
VGVAGGKPAPVVMKGLGFRPARTQRLTGRTWELRLSMGHSPNAAASASKTFSSNLPKPTVVFGTSTTFSKFSFSTVSGTSTSIAPNPIAFTVPFKSTFIYIPIANNHFCWEWRHRNASSKAFMFTDAIANLSSRGIVKASVGKGCGKAKSQAAVLQVSSTSFDYRTQLTGAPSKATALMMIGVTRKKTQLFGWCSSLELLPVIHVFGTADTAGTWTFQGPLASIRNIPSFELLVQYAFSDFNQPFNVGLSDMSVYQTPLLSPPLISRIYTSSTATSAETATSGNFGKLFGLVVGFQQ